MRNLIVEINDLTDEKEFLRRKVPDFMPIFIYIVLVFILTAIIWASFCRIDVIVKADGILRPVENIHTVRNITPGEVKHVFVKDGDIVKSGDMLWSIDKSQFILQFDRQNSILLEKTNELSALTLYEESIRSGTNQFNSLKKKNNEQIEYENRLMIFLNTVRQLSMEAEKHKLDYTRKTGVTEGLYSLSEIENSKRLWETSELKLNNFKNETMLNVSVLIKNTTNEINNIKLNISELSFNLKNSDISSPINGKVQFIRVINTGEFILGQTDIISIIPDSDALKAELLINNKDIGFLRVDQQAKITVIALDQREFGELIGAVKNISADVFMSGANGYTPQYKIICEIADVSLKSRTGTRFPLKNGMLVNARIIVSKKSVMTIILEKLNFISKIYVGV